MTAGTLSRRRAPAAAPSPFAEGISAGTDAAWVAVWTKPRAEKSVARMLATRASSVWLPTLTLLRRWSDRWRHVEVPAFPGYLFAKVPVHDCFRLLVPGVLTLVKRGREPSIIADDEIEALRDAVSRFSAAPPEDVVVDCFEPGDRVRVVNGPLAGLIGVVVERRGSRRLLVGFEQIGQALSVSIGTAAVQRCN